MHLRKYICSAGLALLTVLFISVTVSAAELPASLDSAQLKATLQAAYTNMNAALKAGDLKTYLSYHTSDYKEIDINGAPLHAARKLEPTRASRNDWNTYYDSTHLTQVPFRDRIEMVFMLSDHSALVTVATVHPGRANWLEKTRDTWVKQDGRWLLKLRRRGTLANNS